MLRYPVSVNSVDSLNTVEPGRREFLKGLLGAGALVLSVHWAPQTVWVAGSDPAAAANAVSPMANAPLHPNAYLAIDTDGTVYIIAHRSEMGSGSKTALPRIVAVELDADWARVKIVQAPGDEKFGDQDTDGSHSVRSFFDTLREAGGTARLMLVRAAAAQWNKPVTECHTELHEVPHPIARSDTRAFREKTRIRRTGGFRSKAGSSKKRRCEIKSPQRMALYRQRHSKLRLERYV